MSPKNPAAVALGRKGGKATAEKRTAEQRSAAARKAVEARWAKSMKRIDAKIQEARRLGRETKKSLSKLGKTMGKLKQKKEKP